MPAIYVSTWFADSRRLGAAARGLSSGTLVVEFSIDVPADAAAGVPDVEAAQAALDGVDIGSFTSQLQANIDAEVGKDVYTVSVLSITATVVGDPSATPAPAAPDEAVPLLLVGVVAALLCCLGCGFPVAALIVLRHRRRLQVARTAARGGAPALGSSEPVSVPACLANEPPNTAVVVVEPPKAAFLPEAAAEPASAASHPPAPERRPSLPKPPPPLPEEALSPEGHSVPELPLLPTMPPALLVLMPGPEGLLFAAPAGPARSNNPKRQIVSL